MKEATPLADRIAKARREGRTQQALELAKQLAKQEPSDAHRDLVRDVSFERGCQLLKDGKARDAITVFKNTLLVETPVAFRAQVAAKLAEAGDVAAAIELFQTLPDSPERAKAFTRAVDAAIVGNTKESLPPDLHSAYDAIKTAFDLVEKGQDDAAREALQPIGLSSPFLEWKVMLRGLIAYYQNDDARAQDNWQRFDPDRQPWRLVAPYRFQIDPAFREAQTPPAQERLRTLATRLGGNLVVHALRGLGRAFGSWSDERQARDALKAIQEFVRIHKDSHPALIARFAQLVAIKLVTEGNLDDVSFFRRTFGRLPDDPQLNRLSALVGDAMGHPEDTVEAWIAYEKDVAAMPDRFPGDGGRLARALILEKVARILEPFKQETLPKSVPTIVDCCRKSAELVPTRVEPHLMMLDELNRRDKKREALAVAKELVEKFPDHAPTWEALAESSMSAKQYPSAIEALRHVLRIDPLRHEARKKLAMALWNQAMKASTGASPKPEKYRPLFEESIRLHESPLVARILTWAMVEKNIGQSDEAKRLLEWARERPQHRLAVPLGYHIVGIIDKTAPKDLRAKVKADWLAALAQQPPAIDEAFLALETLEFMGGPKLTGKATIIKSLLPNLGDRTLEPLSVDQLLRLGRLLLELEYRPGVKVIDRVASTRFPDDPFVRLFQFDCVEVKPRNPYSAIRQLRGSLEAARTLAEKLPREAKERVLDEIKPREERLEELEDKHGSGGMLGMERFFNEMMNNFYDMDDEDDELF